MGMFSGPKAPSIPTPPPQAHPPTLGSQMVQATQQQEAKEAAAAEGMGFDDTVKTSPQGLKEAPSTAKATLLGQTGS